MMVKISRFSFFLLVFALLLLAPHHSNIETTQAQSNTIIITEFMASNDNTLADEDGEFSDWIEIHNSGTSAVNLQGYALSDSVGELDKWVFPNILLNTNQYLIVFASGKDRTIAGSELHTNFKLSATGEYLALSDSNRAVVSEFSPVYPQQYADVSFGVNANGDERYFTTPTVGGANGNGIYPYAADAPTASLPRGFLTSAQSVALAAQPGATIYYTLDGSEPTASNRIQYTTPLFINQITILRAIAIVGDSTPSPVATFSYIFHDNVIDQGTPAGWPTGTVNDQQLDYGMDPNVVDGQRNATKLALTKLPSVSLVTELDNLFDPVTGIYVNAREAGPDWEREVSVEWMNADNTGGFQIDGGIRIRGGYSRRGENPKHAFRLYFNGDYDGSLAYPIFGSEGVDTFKKLDLRTAQNYAWSHQGDDRNTFLREVWSRDTQAAMGQPYTRSNYLHLYINGQYWGIYMTQERVAEEYAEDYFGGSEADYDVIKHYKDKGTNPNTVLNGKYSVSAGNDAGWVELWQLVQDQTVTDSEYEQIKEMVDLDSLIDIHLIQFYSAEYDSFRMHWWDWKRANNWYALRDRTGAGTKWRFFAHDAEHSLGAFSYDETEDRTGPVPVLVDNEFYSLTYFNPGWIHQALTSNDQYLEAFQYRAWKHLKQNGGALTPAEARSRWDLRKAQVQPALLAESARWGDAQTEPPRGFDQWQYVVNWVETNWFPNRTNLLMTQLQARDLATSTQPPEPEQPTAPAAKMILNEYNAVAATQVLQESGSDTFFGQILGNGGDWFELVTVVDHLDIRGWTLEIWDADNFSGLRYRAGELKFADQALLADLRRGTILTIAEDVPDDSSYDPANGDWWIHLQANNNDDGSYFTATSQSNFDTNSKAWQLVIRDANGNLLFGPVGEGIGAFPSGLGNAEVGKLEANPAVNISANSAYNDGTSSTFGAPNIWDNGAVGQGFSILRSVVPLNTPTPTSTPTNTPTSTSTNTPVPTSTPVPTNTPIPTSTAIATVEATPTTLATNTVAATNTVTPINTVVETATPTNTPTNTSTVVNESTPTSIGTSVPSNTPTNVPPITTAPTTAPTTMPTATAVNTIEATTDPTEAATEAATGGPSTPTPTTPMPTMQATTIPTNGPTTAPFATSTPAATTSTPADPSETNTPTSRPTTTQPTNTPTGTRDATATAVDSNAATPQPTIVMTATPTVQAPAPVHTSTPPVSRPTLTPTSTPIPSELTVTTKFTDDGAIVMWNFTADRQTLWFQIYRASTPIFDDAERISIDFIPAHFSGTKIYEFTDPWLDSDGTYYYWVEQIYGSNAADVHGPATLLVSGNSTTGRSIYLPLIENR